MTNAAIVAEACREFPDTPTKTLARVLYKRHSARWPTFDACMQAVRYNRGNKGKKNRGNPGVTSRRPNQPSGFKWEFPQSHAKAWEPFTLDSPRTLILSDLHIPFHDTSAIMPLVRDAKRWLKSSDCVLLNGDVCDFFSISRFDKNPTESSLKLEIESTRAFLGWLRAQFPRCRIVYKFGNHDEWFDKYLWRKAPELFGLAQVRLEHLLTQPIPGAEPAIGGIEFITDQRKIVAGHLDILHGHELGKGSIAPPVNPARGFFLKTMECTLAGHLHRTSHHQERTSKGKQIACWSTGCLCGLSPDYARINKWDHSAARLDLNGADFQVTPLRVIHGKLV